MAEALTLARPYAEAVFELAKQGNAFDKWSRSLFAMAQFINNPDIQLVINSPQLSKAKLTEFFLSLAKEDLSSEGRSFVALLVENDRLTLLPQIAALYEEMKRAQQGEVEAHITSAFPLNEVQQQELVTNLQKRFKGKIQPKVSVDKELIGGVKIVVGDEVIDASIKAKLQNMAIELKR